jgi:hypothetical protein
MRAGVTAVPRHQAGCWTGYSLFGHARTHPWGLADIWGQDRNELAVDYLSVVNTRY